MRFTKLIIRYFKDHRFGLFKTLYPIVQFDKEFICVIFFFCVS